MSCSLLLAGIGGVFLSGCATAEAPSEDLFAAMIMTKQQQASSLPTDSGVLLHDPETNTWNRIGPKIMIISSATADPSDPETVFFAAGNGIARTQDGGDTWKLVSGWRESDILQIAVDPENGDIVYAASAWGVSVSHDGGDTWKTSNSGLSEYMCKGIIIDKHNARRLLLATTRGLYESTNQARSWKRVKAIPEIAVMRLRRSEIDPDLWIAGTEGQGAWISNDDARSWKQVGPAATDTANVYGVALDPFNPDNMAIGGWDTGVFYSSDGGSNWLLISSEFPSRNITSIIFDKNISGRVWASTFEEGTFYSDDAGSSWSDPQLYGAYIYDMGYLPSAEK